MRPAPISIATAPISTPSSARCGRAISASTPCISICTRPSRRRMAAAGREQARWCCPNRWRPMRRCRRGACDKGSVSSSSAEVQGSKPFGRITGFHGQMGMFTRALAYMLSHGADGMRQAREDAVLNANYIRRRSRRSDAPFATGPACMRPCSTTVSLKEPTSPRSISPRR